MYINNRRINIEFLAYILLGILIISIVGNRRELIGSDTDTYIKFFDYVKFGGNLAQSFSRIEIGFYWLTQCIAYFTNSKTVYLSLIFFIEFIGITSAFGKKGKIFESYFLRSLIWLSFPFFYSITLNVLRQGIAFIFVIYAIDTKLQKRKYTPYALLMLGVLFHYATFLYVIGFLVVDLKWRYERLLLIWFSVVAASFFGLFGKLIELILNLAVGFNPYFLNYLDTSVDENYRTGFRIVFFVFSTLPIVNYFFLRQYVKNYNGEIEFIFKLYLSVNIMYWFFTRIPFNDRLAVASWLLMPLMIDVDAFKKIGLGNSFKVVLISLAVSVFYYYVFLS